VRRTIPEPGQRSEASSDKFGVESLESGVRQERFDIGLDICHLALFSLRVI